MGPSTCEPDHALRQWMGRLAQHAMTKSALAKAISQGALLSDRRVQLRHGRTARWRIAAPNGTQTQLMHGDTVGHWWLWRSRGRAEQRTTQHRQPPQRRCSDR